MLIQQVLYLASSLFGKFFFWQDLCSASSSFGKFFIWPLLSATTSFGNFFIWQDLHSLLGQVSFFFILETSSCSMRQLVYWPCFFTGHISGTTGRRELSKKANKMSVNYILTHFGSKLWNQKVFKHIFSNIFQKQANTHTHTHIHTNTHTHTNTHATSLNLKKLEFRTSLNLKQVWMKIKFEWKSSLNKSLG